MFLPRKSLLSWIYDSFLPTIEFFRCVSVSLGKFSFNIKIFTKNKTHITFFNFLLSLLIFICFCYFLVQLASSITASILTQKRLDLRRTMCL